MNDIESKTKELWETRAKLAQLRPWPFLKYFVFTKDEHDPNAPRKPFPGYAYQRILCRVWQETPILFVAKSRQIMMTWEIAALKLWDTMFKVNRLTILQSKTQIDANKVMDRAIFMYEALEEKNFPGLPKAKKTGEKTGTKDRLVFPEIDSSLQAIPQGGDIIRSNTSSNIFSDEINHQPEGAQAYGAAKATIDGGGRWFAGGTANGKNWVYRLMHNIDEKTRESAGGNILDSRSTVSIPFKPDPKLSLEHQRLWIEQKLLALSDEEFGAIPLEELISCMPGMDYWVTFKGFHCLRIHYTACPDKDPCTTRGKQWYDQYRDGWQDADWEREMEINYDTWTGRPVIGNYRRDVFVRPVEYNPKLPLFDAVDFGTGTTGAFFAQLARLEGSNFKQLRFLSEILMQGNNANTPNLARLMVQMIQAMYPESWENNNMRCFPDPAGHQSRETTADVSQQTSIKILENHGIRCYSKRIGIVESTQLVRNVFALFHPNGEPAILIHPRCEYLIRLVSGGWHFPDKDMDRGVHEGKPEKDGEFDHGGDMLRQMVANTFKTEDFGRDGPKKQHRKIVRNKYTGQRIGTKLTGRRYVGV